ncbi:MAG: hypothetical protein A2167_03595 [Planctomycetes bacterium RBG_13_46_10]|nr:MAG: hypothetical protein A2167_03595 [Planctomycetes bacterium RBG_13_46_10]
MKSGGLICLIIVLSMLSAANADTITFEDLTLPAESFWNGSDNSGGFRSGNAFFNNNYDSNWESWDGFSYSNITNTTEGDINAQYNAITGSGQGGSSNYAVGYIGWMGPPTITLDEPKTIFGMYVTNNNYAYYSMLNGNPFAKKFGGKNDNDPDFLLLTITGKDSDGNLTGTVEFYLANFRFEDNSRDYIVNTWWFVDLTPLGVVKSLEFSLTSSDSAGGWINTPTYFAIDTIIMEPVPDLSGPYTEAGINGYIREDRHHATPTDANAVINPIFYGWATNVVNYSPAPDVGLRWSDPNKALGPATGDNLDIVSLGDLNQQQLNSSATPGFITLSFSEPIRNGKGYDLVVFENSLISEFDTDGGSVAGLMFAELGYVEVSSNGEDFARFPSVSLTNALTGQHGTIEISKVYNLAGKHPNGNGLCTGTPFDLSELADDPMVVSGIVDINNINYVRIVDIPGSGDFFDEAVMHIDPNTWPDWNYYAINHPIYDAWPTLDSGGLDVEAVGVLEEQNYSADINLDGIVDIADLALFTSAWQSHLGQANWIARCDLAEPKDNVIDDGDLAVFMSQWHKVETWRDK